MHQRRSLVWLGYFIIWLLLGGLAIAVAWQGHITTLYVGALLIENPNWRPLGWSSSTLVGISKLSILLWASLCFIFIMYLEHRLREPMSASCSNVACAICCYCSSSLRSATFLPFFSGLQVSFATC